jgi:hypothetical protein
MPCRIRISAAISGAVAALCLALVPAVVSAAVPVRKGTYRGKTSQSRAVVLKMTRSVRRQDAVEADLRTTCGRIGRITLFAGAVDTRVSPSGRFRNTYIEADFADVGPFLDNGRRRSLFDVTRYELSGRFVSRRRVRGQWVARSLLMDRDSFQDEGALDRCDSGVITWSARLRRR